MAICAGRHARQDKLQVGDTEHWNLPSLAQLPRDQHPPHLPGTPGGSPPVCGFWSLPPTPPRSAGHVRVSLLPGHHLPTSVCRRGPSSKGSPQRAGGDPLLSSGQQKPRISSRARASEQHPQHRQQAAEAPRNLALLSPEATALRGKGGYSPPTRQSKKHPGAPTSRAPGRDAAPQDARGQSVGGCLASEPVRSRSRRAVSRGLGPLPPG